MRRPIPPPSALVLALAALSCLVAPDLPAQGAVARQLRSSHDGELARPRLSPDGSQLTYQVHYPIEARRELYLVDLSARGLGAADPMKLVPESMDSSARYGASKRTTQGFGWASKGAYAYAYAVSGSDGEVDIYIDNWSAMIEGAGDSGLDWDPNEPRFVFSSGRTGNGDLYLWDSSNRGQELQLTFDEVHAELYPLWNREGSKVVYVRAGKGSSDVMLLDVNQFSAQALAQFPTADCTRPSFSPDGSQVAFFSNRETGHPARWSLWVVDARAGATPQQIAPHVRLPSSGAASWTPDGKAVVAVLADDPNADPLALVPVDGGPPQLLRTRTRLNRDPELTVIDGQWLLYFTAFPGGEEPLSGFRRIFVYDIPR